LLLIQFVRFVLQMQIGQTKIAPNNCQAPIQFSFGAILLALNDWTSLSVICFGKS
jgi:hypothetical protein